MGNNTAVPGRKTRVARRRPARQSENAGACDTARVISSVAQGLAQAQCQPTMPQAEQEILRVLQRIEQHLAAEKTDRFASGTDSNGNNSNGIGGAATDQGGSTPRSNVLKQLLASLQQLTGKQQNQSGMASRGGKVASDILASAGDRQQAAGQTGNKGKGQGVATTSPAGSDADGMSLDPQQAAQLLAQAQYNLANELEASLQKLRQVINESEKIATKVSTLLQQQDGET